MHKHMHIHITAIALGLQEIMIYNHQQIFAFISIANLYYPTFSCSYNYLKNSGGYFVLTLSFISKEIFVN